MARSRKREYSITHNGRRFRGYHASTLKVLSLRCERFLPAETSPTTPNIIWMSYNTAKLRNPGAPPYRCPGVLVIDKETGQRSFSPACECASARLKFGRPTKSVHSGSFGVNSTGCKGDQPRGHEVPCPVIKRRGRMVGKLDSAYLYEAIGEPATDNAAVDLDEGTSGSSHFNDDDASSLASDKSLYKNLCRRLTASLIEKKGVKRENKQVKRENKRLKRENLELNERLRDISNVCVGHRGNR